MYAVGGAMIILTPTKHQPPLTFVLDCWTDLFATKITPTSRVAYTSL